MTSFYRDVIRNSFINDDIFKRYFFKLFFLAAFLNFFLVYGYLYITRLDLNYPAHYQELYFALSLLLIFINVYVWFHLLYGRIKFVYRHDKLRDKLLNIFSLYFLLFTPFTGIYGIFKLYIGDWRKENKLKRSIVMDLFITWVVSFILLIPFNISLLRGMDYLTKNSVAKYALCLIPTFVPQSVLEFIDFGGEAMIVFSSQDEVVKNFKANLSSAAIDTPILVNPTIVSKFGPVLNSITYPFLLLSADAMLIMEKKNIFSIKYPNDREKFTLNSIVELMDRTATHQLELKNNLNDNNLNYFKLIGLTLVTGPWQTIIKRKLDILSYRKATELAVDSSLKFKDPRLLNAIKNKEPKKFDQFLKSVGKVLSL